MKRVSSTDPCRSTGDAYAVPLVLRSDYSALAVGSARAQDDPKAIVAQAIKAHGGEEKLTKLKATKTKGKGTIMVMGNPLEFTVDAISQQPNQMRNEVKVEAMGQSFTVVQVLNKDKAWKTVNGQMVDIDTNELEGLKDQVYGDYVESLVPLLKGDFKLEALGALKVDDKPAVGVKVSSKGHKDIKLFFDKESHLLVRSQSRGKDEGMNEIDVQSTVSNFKDVEGVKTPTKIQVMRDGKKFIDLEVTEIKLMEKADPANFEKP